MGPSSRAAKIERGQRLAQVSALVRTAACLAWMLHRSNAKESFSIFLSRLQLTFQFFTTIHRDRRSRYLDVRLTMDLSKEIMQPLPRPSLCKVTLATPLAADLQVLVFRLGGRSFCVPVAHVRYVAALPPDFSCFGAEADKYFVFDDEPLAYVSLWDEFELRSEYAEYREMQEMLPKRRQDHVDWMAALEDSIRVGTAFTKARNPRECAFGKWFYGYQAKDQRLSLLLEQFEQPHAKIHALADRLLGWGKNGQSAEALDAFHEAEHTTFGTVLRLFDLAQELIVKLQRRIAIVVADKGNTCVLGADSVRDIVTLPAERIKQQRAADGELGMVSALVLLEDRSVVPLLNWRKFCTEQAC